MKKHLPKLAPCRTLADLPRFAPIRRPATATPRRSRGRDWKATHRHKTAFDMEEAR